MSDDEGERPRSFWRTVELPLREGLIILLVVAVLAFLVGTVRDGWLFGLISAWFMGALCSFAWVLHHTLKAWAEWPAEGRWTGRLKRFIRFLLTDS